MSEASDVTSEEAAGFDDNEVAAAPAGGETDAPELEADEDGHR